MNTREEKLMVVKKEKKAFFVCLLLMKMFNKAQNGKLIYELAPSSLPLLQLCPFCHFKSIYSDKWLFIESCFTNNWNFLINYHKTWTRKYFTCFLLFFKWVLSLVVNQAWSSRKVFSLWQQWQFKEVPLILILSCLLAVFLTCQFNFCRYFNLNFL